MVNFVVLHISRFKIINFVYLPIMTNLIVRKLSIVEFLLEFILKFCIKCFKRSMENDKNEKIIINNDRYENIFCQMLNKK